MDTLELAGVRIGFDYDLPITYDEVMTPFMSEQEEDQVDEIVRVAELGCQQYAQNIWSIVDKMDLPTILCGKRVLILHASYLIYDGKAILFTGPSGIGKSTQANLWKTHLQAEIINGDRALLKEDAQGLHAYGLPFAGSSGISKRKDAPIRAIVILKQGKENIVRTLSYIDVIKMMYTQVAMNRKKPEEIIRAMDLIEQFVKKTTVVEYTCRMDADAVSTLHQYLEQEEMRWE